MLKSLVVKWLELTGIPKNSFCRLAGIDNTSFNKWINHNIPISATTERNIREALEREQAKMKNYLGNV